VKPSGVGMVHMLRHSGAIERLRLTGNPRSVQAQLGHKTIDMTMRYLRTLSDEEGVAIQAGVDLGR
jgi:integrase